MKEAELIAAACAGDEDACRNFMNQNASMFVSQSKPYLALTTWMGQETNDISAERLTLLYSA